MGTHVSAEPAEAAAAAAAAADAAARTAGIAVRSLRAPADLAALDGLFRSIWGESTVAPELLRALAHAGNYVVGAYAGGLLVGGCVGFFADPSARTLHSHAAGVSLNVRGRSVGFALKLHQRAWVLGRGIARIAWTFDPLVRRNASFNITKLAVRVASYERDFYGTMHDAINAGDRSDRLLVEWPLAAPAVVRACAGAPAEPALEELYEAGAAVLLDANAEGRPRVDAANSPVALVRVPPDIEALRRTDPSTARAWRDAVADTLGQLLTDGAEVTGFIRSGWYVVTR